MTNHQEVECTTTILVHKKKINKDKSLRLGPLENSNKKTGKYLEMWNVQIFHLRGEEGVLAVRA